MERVINKTLIKNWINEAGNSKEKLAYLSGRSTSYIEKLLRGVCPMPPVDVAQKMADIIEVSFDELFPVRDAA